MEALKLDIQYSTLIVPTEYKNVEIVHYYYPYDSPLCSIEIVNNYYVRNFILNTNDKTIISTFLNFVKEKICERNLTTDDKRFFLLYELDKPNCDVLKEYFENKTIDNYVLFIK